MQLQFLLGAASMAAVALARGPSKFSNPVVVAPLNGTYMAGSEMTIEWANATTGFVNIQLVNDFNEVLSNPITVALGVPAADNKYVWKIPPTIRSAAGYRVAVWGVAPSTNLEKTGNTQSFTIVNNLKEAVTTFKVLTPNAQQPCATNAPCVITWDFPSHMDDRPAEVHIRLFKGSSLKPAFTIAHNVPADQKTYTWNVPNDAALLGQDMYVSVNAEAAPPAGPGLGDNMGGNGNVFKLDSVLPQPDIDEEALTQQAKTEDEVVTESVVETVTNIVTEEIKKQSSGAASVAPVFPVAALVLAIVPLAFMI